MPKKKLVELVLKLIEAIDAHDPEAIVGLMAADAAFVDSLGNSVEGTARLRAAWEGYFQDGSGLFHLALRNLQRQCFCPVRLSARNACSS